MSNWWDLPTATPSLPAPPSWTPSPAYDYEAQKQKYASTLPAPPSIPAEPPSPPTSWLGEIGTGFSRGAQETKNMFGQALQYGGQYWLPGAETGKQWAQEAQSALAQPEMQLHPDQHNVITNTLASGAEVALPVLPALAGGVAAGMAAPALGLGAVGTGAAVGAANLLGALPFGASAAQQTLDETRAANVPEDQAQRAALINAGINTAGPALLGGMAGRMASPFARAVGGSAAEAIAPGIVKPFLRELPADVAKTTGIMAGLSAGTAGVKQAYDIPTESPMQAAIGSIQPSIGMSALLAPLGLVGRTRYAQQAKARATLLSDASTPPEIRQAAANEVYTDLQGRHPEAAQQFQENANAAIQAGMPLTLDESVFKPLTPEAVTANHLNEPLTTPRGQTAYTTMANRVHELSDAQLQGLAATSLPDNAPDTLKTAQTQYQNELTTRTAMADMAQHFAQNPSAVKGITQTLSDLATGKPLYPQSKTTSSAYSLSLLPDDMVTRYRQAANTLLSDYGDQLGKGKADVEKARALLEQEAQQRENGQRSNPEEIRLSDLSAKIATSPIKSINGITKGLSSITLDQIANTLEPRVGMEPGLQPRIQALRNQAASIRSSDYQGREQAFKTGQDERFNESTPPKNQVMDDQGQVVTTNKPALSSPWWDEFLPQETSNGQTEATPAGNRAQEVRPTENVDTTAQGPVSDAQETLPKPSVELQAGSAGTGEGGTTGGAESPLETNQASNVSNGQTGPRESIAPSLPEKPYEEGRKTEAASLLNTPDTQEATNGAHSVENTGKAPDMLADNPSLLQGISTQEIPIDKLTLSEEVPQFKAGANQKTGVVEPLGGKYERTGSAPIIVWERNNGQLEVISGRHRLDLARRSGEETIPAQVMRESDGFTAQKAAILDAELNIRDGQGKVKDYVNYFQHAKLSKEDAQLRGLISRSIGQRAYAIANEGTQRLIAAHRADQIGDTEAFLIAKTAPLDDRLQTVGIKAIQDGKTIYDATNLMQAMKSMSASGSSQDMFGFDDTALRQAERMAQIASRHQRQLSEQLSAVQGAAKRPEQARKLGVDVTNPGELLAKIASIKAEREAWASWSTNPDLIAKIREEADRTRQATQDSLPGIGRSSIGSGSSPTSIDAARASVRQAIGPDADRLEQQGRIVYHETDPTGEGAAGFVDQKGVVHFIPSNMDTSAASIAAHEGVHIGVDTGRFDRHTAATVRLAHRALSTMGLRRFIGDPSFSDLQRQAKRLADEGQLDAVKARDQVDRLVRAGKMDPAKADEEQVAYLAQHAPAQLPFVKRILSAIRSTLYRMGVKVALKPEDVRGMALNALKNASMAGGGDVRYARRSALPTSEKPPEETKDQAFRRAMQDKANRYQVVQDWLKKSGINVSPPADVYGADALLPKKTADGLERARETVLKPAVEKAARNRWRLGMGDMIQALIDEKPLPQKFTPSISEYLHAQHALESNPIIAKKNKLFPDGGTGLTNQEAQDILSRYQRMPNFAAFRQAAQQFQAITKLTRQLLVESGRITPELAKQWERDTPNYVPLMGGPEDKSAQGGTGPGVSMGMPLKQRMGHDLRDENIVENIWRRYEQAIYLNQKKAVTTALKNLLTEAKNEQIGTIGKPEKQAVMHNGWVHQVWIDGQPLGAYASYTDAKKAIESDAQWTGRAVSKYAVRHQLADQSVVYMTKPLLADHEVAHYENGQLIRLQLNDPLMAQAARNLGTDAASGLLKMGMAFNRMLSHMYTGYNPEFLISNVLRDFTHGFINNTGQYGIKTSLAIVKSYPRAVADLWQHVNGKQNAWVERYQRAGGSTGAAYMSDLERIGTDIKHVFQDYQGAVETWKSGDKWGAARVASLDQLRLVGGWIEKMNRIGENAFRLATFKTLIDQKRPETEAARAAGDVTVNFNRKGEMASTFGGLYLFFNPSVQGTASLINALTKAPHHKQALALAGSMAALALTVAELSRSGDDDQERAWKQIPGYVKDRNLLLPTGVGKPQLAVPIPYGYGIFWSLGNLMSDIAHGEDKTKAGIRLAAAMFNQFSPFGSPFANDELNMKNIVSVLPTMLKPPVALALNRNELGRPIMPEEQPWNTALPNSERKWRSTVGTPYDMIATAINRWTGGNKYQAGAVDISPETLRYLTRTLTGGVGQFAVDTLNLGVLLAQGAGSETELREYPIIRRFARENTIQDSRALFQEQANQVRLAVDAFNAARRANDAQGMQTVAQNSREMLALGDVLQATRAMLKVRRMMEDQINQSNLPVLEKRKQLDQMQKQEDAVYTQFYRIFESAKARKDAA